MTVKRGRRIPRAFVRRAVYSFVLVALVVVIGTVGIHLLEGLSYLDSFYFTAMMATGEGPIFIPVTAAGKVFAGLLAFVSVGIVITCLFFIFGPFFGSVLRLGLEKLEEGAEREREKEKMEGSS